MILNIPETNSINMIILDVIKELVIQYKRAYDEMDILFRNSTTCQMLPTILLNISQDGMMSNYSIIKAKILELFSQEQYDNHYLENIFSKNNFSQEKDEIKKLAFEQHISIEDAYQQWSKNSNKKRTTNLLIKKKIEKDKKKFI